MAAKHVGVDKCVQAGHHHEEKEKEYSEIIELEIDRETRQKYEKLIPALCHKSGRPHFNFIHVLRLIYEEYSGKMFGMTEENFFEYLQDANILHLAPNLLDLVFEKYGLIKVQV